MSREWKVLMKKSAGVIEKCLRRIFIYANNEPKSALARDPGDCRDNKGKLAKRVFTCLNSRLIMILQKRGKHDDME